MSIWFSNKTYATIWSVTEKGKVANVNFSTSRKVKDSDPTEYKNSSWFGNFVGEAHDKVSGLGRGTRIIITKACMGKEPYEVDGETKFPQTGQIVVFDFDLSGGAPASSGPDFDKAPDVEEASPEGEDEFPF
jgi:hypothetical protein